ncbi:MAG: cation diffusion facilitator family transporter [Candidatus Zixiibacteriota bacterium]
MGNAATVGTASLPKARTYAYLSVAASILTLALKLVAYWLTGSVGLLSDAAESLINLAAALVAVWALTVAGRPPDAKHAYGHSKAEYFASATEGLLILLAAVGIGATAWERLLHPQPLVNVWTGLAISGAAAVINGTVAVMLLRAGRRLRSITLAADAHHLLTDVWTTGGVLIAVGLVRVTGWFILDPLVAIIVAVNIVWTGLRLLRDTAEGVLDTAISEPDQQVIAEILEPYRVEGVAFHALRTRVAGQRRFIALHILVPGDWTVQRGHALCEEVEAKIVAALPKSTVDTHLEPVEESVSWGDEGLDRHGG